MERTKSVLVKSQGDGGRGQRGWSWLAMSSGGVRRRRVLSSQLGGVDLEVYLAKKTETEMRHLLSGVWDYAGTEASQGQGRGRTESDQLKRSRLGREWAEDSERIGTRSPPKPGIAASVSEFHQTSAINI